MCSYFIMMMIIFFYKLPKHREHQHFLIQITYTIIQIIIMIWSNARKDKPKTAPKGLITLLIKRRGGDEVVYAYLSKEIEVFKIVRLGNERGKEIVPVSRSHEDFTCLSQKQNL